VARIRNRNHCVGRNVVSSGRLATLWLMRRRVRDLALVAIRFYQRSVSPYKGFRCAYRVRTGQASCSALGYRAIRRFGIGIGLAILGERTRRCGDVYRAARATGFGRYQHGHCDAVPVDGCHGVDSCSFEHGSDWSWISDCGNCDGGSCDWWGPKKTRKKRTPVRISPKLRVGKAGTRSLPNESSRLLRQFQSRQQVVSGAGVDGE
jgi:uncharacterized protein